MPISPISFQPISAGEYIFPPLSIANTNTLSSTYSHFSDSLKGFRNSGDPLLSAPHQTTQQLTYYPATPTPIPFVGFSRQEPELSNQSWKDIFGEDFVEANHTSPTTEISSTIGDNIFSEDALGINNASSNTNNVAENNTSNLRVINPAQQETAAYFEKNWEQLQEASVFSEEDWQILLTTENKPNPAITYKKAIASQITPTLLIAWQANHNLPQNQRLTLQQFTQKHNITNKLLANYIKIDGTLRARGHDLLRRASTPSFQHITAQTLTAWQANQELSEDQRLTPIQFAHTFSISLRIFRQYIHSNGTLKQSGQDLLLRPQKHVFNPISTKILNAWQTNQQLLGSQRLLPEQFADTHNISIPTLANYIKKNGTLRPRGKNMFQRAQGHQFNQINADILNAWQANQQLLTDQRLTLAQFIRKHNLVPMTLAQYIRKNGTLTQRGQTILQQSTGHRFTPISADIIRTWQNNIALPNSQRLSFIQFSEKYNIAARRLYRYVALNGSLKQRGENLLRRASKPSLLRPITPEILTAWQTNQLLPKEHRLTPINFARTHHISRRLLYHYISPNGILRSLGIKLCM